MTRHKAKEARHLDHIALVSWLILVREGGYSTAAEVRAMHRNAGVTEVRLALERLVSNGMVRKRKVLGAWPTFGVTTSCKAPPGYEAELHGEAA